MAIAYDTSVNLASSTGTQSWSHTAAASLVGGAAVVISGGSVEETTGVTYGGTAMTRIATGANTSGETGTTSVWFLGSSEAGWPGSGTQTVEVTRSASSAYIATSYSVTTSSGTAAEVLPGGINVGYDEGSSTNISSISTSLTIPNGTQVWMCGGLYSGENALGSITDNGDLTRSHSNDFGNFVSVINRRTSIYTGTGAAYTNFAWTQSSDDGGWAVIAVRQAASATNASAGHAAGAGAAYAGSTALTTSAGHAAGTGSSYAAAGGLGALAGHASAVGTAYDPTLDLASNANAEQGSSATGTANDPTAAVTVNAGHASATGAAYDATVDTTTATNAPAEHAAATGTAQTPSTAITVGAGHASATGTAYDVTAALGAAAGHAAGTGAALDESAALTVNAEHAAATGAALDPTVSTSTDTQADAEHAAATGTAYAPTLALTVLPGGAAGTGAAYGPTPALAVLPGGASATGTAYDATVTIAGGAATANAGLASVTGTAYDATVSISQGGRGGRVVVPTPEAADDFETSLLLVI